MDENQSNSIENPNSAEMEIDLMGILHKIIAIRKVIYKAAGIGLVIGVIVAISIPKQYTVEVTLSPEMGTAKSSGLSGLAASFLGSGMTMGDDIDALNTSLSAESERRKYYFGYLFRFSIFSLVELCDRCAWNYD